MIPDSHPWNQLKLELKEPEFKEQEFKKDEPKLIRKKTNCYSKPKLNYETNHYYSFEEKKNNCKCIIS